MLIFICLVVVAENLLKSEFHKSVSKKTAEPPHPLTTVMLRVKYRPIWLRESPMSPFLPLSLVKEGG